MKSAAFTGRKVSLLTSSPPFKTGSCAERVGFRRRYLGLFAGLMALGSALGSAPLNSAEPAPAREDGKIPCRLGFSSRMFTDINENDAKASVKVWAQVLATERNIPLNTEPRVMYGVGAITEALRKKQVDCVAMTTDEYRVVSQEVDLSSLIVSLKDGEATEEYIILVRQDNGIEKIEHLRKRTLAVFQSARTGVAESWLAGLLAQKGLGPPEEFCGAITRPSKLLGVVLPVFFRRVDACLVTRRGYATMCELNPQMGRQLKALETSSKLVPVVFAFRRDFAPPFFDRLISEMTKIQTTPAGQQVLTIFQCDRLEVFPLSALQGTLDLLARSSGSITASNAPAWNGKDLDRAPSGGPVQ